MSKKSKRVRRHPKPAPSYSIHDLEYQKKGILAQLRMAVYLKYADRQTGNIPDDLNTRAENEYKEAAYKALIAMFKRHARHTGNLDKYKGHNGEKGYRNPHYLWDNLTTPHTQSTLNEAPAQ